MKRVYYPKEREWKTFQERAQLPSTDVGQAVRQIMEAVEADGDKAIRSFVSRFDGFVPSAFRLSPDVLITAERELSTELKEAIKLAKSNIERFHKAQRSSTIELETQPGVRCWQKSLPIEKVGLYIPGGSAPLFSTLLMLGIPARLAGCREIVVCTPANQKGEVHPAIRYVANLLGIDQVYAVGGAQAIAAMAYGTESIPKVYKIFGPGNQFVTKAKELVQQEGVAIDMPAGPSEVLVIADNSASPAFVAADLLSQAEHGPDSQVILLTPSPTFLEDCLTEVQRQLEKLPRKEIAQRALENSWAICLPSLEVCMHFSNQYAPEHLILAVQRPEKWAEKVCAAGSVFLGNYSCESAGDYASGTNHTLPTNGAAHAYSGISLGSFMRTVSFQQISAKGLQQIGPSIMEMAKAEGLEAHSQAVQIRLKSIML